MLRDTSTYLYKHFTLPDHSINDLELSVIDYVTFIQNRNADNILRERENFWIRVFCSAYPFGLNDRIDGCVDISNGYCPTGDAKQPYFSQPTLRRKRSHGIRKRRENSFLDLNNCIAVLKNLFRQETNCRKLFIKLRELTPSQLKSLFYEVSNLPFDNNDATFKLAILGFYTGNYSKPNQLNKSNQTKIWVTANYIHQGLEIVNPLSILNNRQCRRLLPIRLNEIPKVTVTYKLKPPTSLKLLNYSRFLTNFKIDTLDNELHYCNCNTSEFCYTPAGHVITGNLDIIRNSSLREIFRKGTKFRIPDNINSESLRTELYNIVDQFIRKTASKLHVDSRLFNDYKNETYRIIDARTVNLTAVTTKENIFRDNDATAELKRLHQNYIITCADKAANNFVFICKPFYCRTLAKEMGLEFDNTRNEWCFTNNETYTPARLNHNDIVLLHHGFSKREPYKLNVPDYCSKIPNVYIIPKLHKNPYKFRPIAGAKNCSLQPLSRMLHYILTLFKNHFSNYCNVIRRRTGTRCYWAIESNQSALRDLQKHVNGISVQCAYSFDFSTLYTKLPLKTVCEQLYYLCDLLFRNNGSKNYVLVNKKYCLSKDTVNSNQRKVCFYSNSAGNQIYASLRVQDIKELIHFCLNEYYVSFGSKFFKAKCGIAQGAAASPTVALMTLAVLEFRFLTDSNNQLICNRLNNIWRYLDDILIINVSADEFKAIAKRIYPESLPITQSSGSNTSCAFLDLQLIYNPSFRIKVYDKTSDFNFSVVKFIFAESDVPTRLGYNVFFAQVIRYARICSHVIDFTEKTKELFVTLINNGFNRRILNRILPSFFSKYQYLLVKYGITTKNDFTTKVLYHMPKP